MESAKECVTTHLPKQLALKMVWRSSILPILGRRDTKAGLGPGLEVPVSRRVAAVCAEGTRREPAWSRRWCRSWW